MGIAKRSIDMLFVNIAGIFLYLLWIDMAGHVVSSELAAMAGIWNPCWNGDCNADAFPAETPVDLACGLDIDFSRWLGHATGFFLLWRHMRRGPGKIILRIIGCHAAESNG